MTYRACPHIGACSLYQVVVTTSRDPSSRLKQFAKEIRLVFPGATRLNRGNLVIGDLLDVCRSNEVTDIIVLHEHRGEADGFTVCHMPHGPTAFFSTHRAQTAGLVP